MRLSHPRPVSFTPLRHRRASITLVAALVGASACGDTPARTTLAPSPAPTRSAAQLDSAAMGYLAPRLQGLRFDASGKLEHVTASGGVSVVNVNPGWFQGASQPNLIVVDLAGPVKSVTITGGSVLGDALLCSGNYGKLSAYDATGVPIGEAPLTLINPADCGFDDLTFGAQATFTSSNADIVRVLIFPMSPLNFPVNGVPGGHASATYVAALGPDPDPNRPPVARFNNVCRAGTRTCTFDASGSSDDNGIVSYKWDLNIGPAGRVTGPVAKVTFPGTGVRTVTLTVTDAGGRSATASQAFLFDLSNLPPIIYGPDPRLTTTCTGLVCTFDTSASTDDVAIVSRMINFGDGLGVGGNEAVATHTYARPGTYNIALVVMDNTGSGTNLLSSVTVPPAAPVDAPPTALFWWSCPSISAHKCTFDASASSDDVGIVS